MYEAQIRFPRGYTLLSEPRVEGGNLISRAGNVPIVIHLDARESHATFLVRTPQGEPREYSVLMRFKEDVRKFQVHPTCAENGVAAWTSRKAMKKPDEKTGEFLFAGIVCRNQGPALDVYLIHARETQVSHESGRSPNARGPDWLLFRFPQPKASEVSKRRLLLRFAVKDPRTATSWNQFVFYQPRAPSPGRIRLDLGAGLTFLQYTEKPQNHEITGMAVTLKGSAIYPLFPDLLDVGVSAFGNVITFPFFRSDDALRPPRFVGVNGRVGYKLPLDLGAMTWRFLGGWYLWKMLVSDNAYGISLMGGPQIFISATYAQRGSRTVSGYFKYAAVSPEVGQLSFSTYELAFGGAYQVSRPDSRRPWMLTLDLSTLNFAEEKFLNRISLQTMSLGVSTSF